MSRGTGLHTSQQILVAACLLGTVHGRVCRAAQLCGVAAILGIHGNADGDGYIDAEGLGFDGFGDTLKYAAGDHQGIVLVRQLSQNDDKFIPARTGKSIHGTQPRTDACDHLLQADIARGMTEGVVDFFKAIEIETKHGCLVSVTGSLGEAALHTIFKQQPIGQTGKQIMVGLVDQQLMQLLAIGYVLHQNKTAAAAAVIDRVGRGVDLDVRTVFAAVAPGAGKLGSQGAAILCEDRVRVFCRAQILQGHANKFFAFVAIVRNGSVVDFENAQRLRVLHPHRVRMGGEEETVMFRGLGCCQKLIFQQGDDHAESHKELRNVPQFRRNVSGWQQVRAKERYGKNRGPRDQAQDGGEHASGGPPEIEPVKSRKGEERLKKKGGDAPLRLMPSDKEGCTQAGTQVGRVEHRPYPGTRAGMPGEQKRRRQR